MCRTIAAIPISNKFVDLVSGVTAANNGTFTETLNATIGPVVTYPASSDCSFTVPSITTTTITVAAIFQGNAASQFAMCSLGGAGTFFTNGTTFMFYDGLVSDSSIAYAANTPYFVAASVNTTTSVHNFIV